MRITVTQDDVLLNSPEEALFYGLCHFHEVLVERVMMSAAAEGGGALFYWPGFCISSPGELALYAEVSDGQNESAMRPLRASWRLSTPHRLAVLYREELRTLMFCMNGHVIEQQLRTWAR